MASQGRCDDPRARPPTGKKGRGKKGKSLPGNQAGTGPEAPGDGNVEAGSEVGAEGGPPGEAEGGQGEESYAVDEEDEGGDNSSRLSPQRSGAV